MLPSRRLLEGLSALTLPPRWGAREGHHVVSAWRCAPFGRFSATSSDEGAVVKAPLRGLCDPGTQHMVLNLLRSLCFSPFLWVAGFAAPSDRVLSSFHRFVRRSRRPLLHSREPCMRFSFTKCATG